MSLPNCQVSTRVLLVLNKMMCLTVHRLYFEQNLGEEVFGRLYTRDTLDDFLNCNLLDFSGSLDK